MRPAKPIRMSHRIQTIGPQTSTPTPKLIVRVATRAGKKEKLCWRKKNRLGVYLFVRFFRLVFNSHRAQSTRFCSKRIFLLVNATQLDLVSLQSLGPVLVHPPPN